MRNFRFKQQISDANASGCEHSFAPQNIRCNTSFNPKVMQNIKDSQNGRSMIEMLGVLAIIGVLSVGGIAGYSKAMHKYRINKTIEQITLIAGNIRAFFGPQKSYKGVSDNTVLRKAKLIPDEMITVNDDGEITAITNPFGGVVDVCSEDNTKSMDDQAFEIIYDLGDNEEACIELHSQDWSMLSSNVIIRYIYGPDFYLLPPLDIDEAVLLCSKMKEWDGRYFLSLRIDVNLSSDYWKRLLSDCKLPDGC